MTQTGKRTVLFDLDGTLLRTVEDLAAAVNHALALHGYPTHPVEKIQRMVGNGVGLLVARALPQGFDAPDYDAVLADFREHYSAHCRDATRPYDGVPELLRALREQGWRVAVVTNKYQDASEALMERYFPGLVDAVSGDAPDRRRKPAPDGVNAALAALGAGRDGAVYVGDTEVDFETAKNAGLPCVCVSWGYRTRAELEEQGIAPVADTAAELLELLNVFGRCF